MIRLRLPMLGLFALVMLSCGEDYVEHAISRVQDGDALHRRLAAEDLGRLRDSRAAPALIGALADAEVDVRCAAARALGELGTRSAAPALLDMLVRRRPGLGCAMVALGKLREPSAAGALVAALVHPNGDRLEARSAVEALASLGAAGAPPLLAALREQRVPWVRDDLSEALASAHADVLAPLLEMLRDESSWARANAATALGYLGNEGAVGPLVEAFALVPEAGPALSRIGGSALPALFAMLASPDEARRDHASGSLGAARDPRVLDLLGPGLLSPEPLIVAGCARALADLAGEQLDLPIPNPSSQYPLHGAAAALLDAAWERRDLRVIAAALLYMVRRYPGEEAVLLAAFERHGDNLMAATVLLGSPSDRLRKAVVSWGARRGFRVCDPDFDFSCGRPWVVSGRAG